MLDLDALLHEAVRREASDVHIKVGSPPYLRIDGVLEPVAAMPDVTAADTERVAFAIMPKARADEFLECQEADFAHTVSGLGRFRVNVFRQRGSVGMVLRRVLPGIPSFESLGLPPVVRRLAEEPRGLVLVTGPTGSGKTTTLYAALSRLDSHTTNIMTVEDPIEYDLDGIGQTQVNPRIDMTFGKALRAILRQDPDVIMIGEIRDYETAQIAIQASLTGHLVLATLHTNDAVSAVTRLTDMGVEPFLLSSSMLGVLAQRLVRTLCPTCKQPDPDVTRDTLNEMLKPWRLNGGVKPYKPVGCLDCRNTGYRGRAGLFELLLLSDEAVMRTDRSDLCCCCCRSC